MPISRHLLENSRANSIKFILFIPLLAEWSGYAGKPLKRLEPRAGKLACTVLRRVVAGNGHSLSDTIGLQTPSIAMVD